MDFSTLKNNLEKRGFVVSLFSTINEANEYLNAQIDDKSIGFGGSVTLDEMGILKMLEKHNKVLDRFDNPGGQTPAEVMKELPKRVRSSISTAIATESQGSCTVTKECISSSAKTRLRPTSRRLCGVQEILLRRKTPCDFTKTRPAQGTACATIAQAPNVFAKAWQCCGENPRTVRTKLL